MRTWFSFVELICLQALCGHTPVCMCVRARAHVCVCARASSHIPLLPTLKSVAFCEVNIMPCSGTNGCTVERLVLFVFAIPVILVCPCVWLATILFFQVSFMPISLLPCFTSCLQSSIEVQHKPHCPGRSRLH